MSSIPQTATTVDGTPLDKPTAAPSLRERVRLATRKIESEIILETLEQHRWNRRRTAEALRISYRLLMYKMKSCNIRDTTLERPPSAH
jgi:two-component system response regulator AtoC